MPCIVYCPTLCLVVQFLTLMEVTCLGMVTTRSESEGMTPFVTLSTKLILINNNFTRWQQHIYANSPDRPGDVSSHVESVRIITYIISIMQLTTYLIFILVLVLEAIKLGFTATQLKAFNFSRYKFQGCCPYSCIPPSFFYCIQIPTTLTLLALFFLLLTTGIQLTTPSSTYFMPPTPHSSSPPPQNQQSSSLVSPHVHLHTPKLCCIVCRFSINGGHHPVDHALVCTNWCK